MDMILEMEAFDMDFLELAKNRYSERYFDPKPVEQEKLDKNWKRDGLFRLPVITSRRSFT